MPAPARTRGWATRWHRLVVERQNLPFTWGGNDCAAFVCDAVQVLHEADTLAPLRLPRASALQAVRVLRRLNGPLALARCGLEPVPAAMARVGDVVLLLQGRMHLLAMCNGADALAPGPAGLECTRMAHAVAAWRV